MGAWLKSYFTDFKYTSITTEDTKNHFMNFFKKRGGDAATAIDTIDWEHWLHGEGLPDFDLDKYIDSSLIDACQQLADQWDESKNSPPGANNGPDDLKSFKAHQVMVFLDFLIDSEWQEFV